MTFHIAHFQTDYQWINLFLVHSCWIKINCSPVSCKGPNNKKRKRKEKRLQVLLRGKIGRSFFFKLVENYYIHYLQKILTKTGKQKSPHTLPLPTFGRARCSMGPWPLWPLNPLPLRKRPGTPNVSMFNFFSSAHVVLLSIYNFILFFFK